MAGSADRRHPLVAEMAHWPRSYASGPLRVLELPAAPRLRARCAARRARCAQLLARARPRPGGRLPDAQPHAPRARGADAHGGRGGRRHAAHPPGRRHDEAGRPRPLHARALLPGARATGTTTRRGRCSACCRSPCAWRARARRCGTRSSGATTAPATSSSGATTRARASTRRASRSTDRTTRRTLARRAPAASSASRRCPLGEMVYLPDEDRYEEVATRARGRARPCRSRARPCATILQTGEALPDWFTRPEVARILQEAYPPAGRRGLLRVVHGPARRRQDDDRRGADRPAARARPPGDARSTATSCARTCRRASASAGRTATRTSCASGSWRPRSCATTGWRSCAAVSPYRRRATRPRGMVGADRFVVVLRRHAARGLRGARHQGPVREGAPRRGEGRHRHRRSLRGARGPRRRAADAGPDARGVRAAGDRGARRPGPARRLIPSIAERSRETLRVI